MVEKKGALVISLDFEMMWGNLENWTVEGYGKSNVAQVRLVIDKLLELFDNYHVKATFATVGFLMLDGKKAVIDHMPLEKPSYLHAKSPYNEEFIGNLKDNDEYLYFASDIVDKLKKYKNIEIGTHTFSHYYCWEEGQTVSQFEADLKKAIDIASRNNIELKSIVFPRNQVSEEYLEICAANGIKVYRGNAKKYYDQTTTAISNILQRISRLIDAYINLGGYTSYPKPSIIKFNGNYIVNLPASRILRPFTPKLAFAESMRLRRIKKEIIHAAKHNEIYHLWWHPHNFGANLEKNISFLEKILKSYKDCHEKYGMLSMTMSEYDNYKDKPSVL